MLKPYEVHNQLTKGFKNFTKLDPHLSALSQLKYQYSADWWKELKLNIPGIYILTGGRQIGKSTSCKLLIKHCLQKKKIAPKNMFYLPCDEIYDAKELGQKIRFFLSQVTKKGLFLLIIDEITFVKNWDRTIKALADEGLFNKGLCILTGSDTLILKEAAMRFPGRRGKASKIDFHIYPLTFFEYVSLRKQKSKITNENLLSFFEEYAHSGGYLRAINDFAENGIISESTFLTYEQWIRGDFLKQGKNEENLLQLLKALLTIGSSQISYSSLTQKIGLISKETCIDYLNLLQRMDVLINLQAFDQTKKTGFPKKARKFHFLDPFIYHTIFYWLKREGYLNSIESFQNSSLIEGLVASHCRRFGKTFYFKGQGEIDVIWLKEKLIQALEVKWSNQIKSNDLKMLKQFKNSTILGKSLSEGYIDHIKSIPLYKFLYSMK
ncbi:MAG: hypothetical protein KR126chlam5_00037 [Candidatus Anoxychlamydiales bacterium]|nr:hypothetical protein [Candidatus Anoxychlamydiales bacterium]